MEEDNPQRSFFPKYHSGERSEPAELAVGRGLG